MNQTIDVFKETESGYLKQCPVELQNVIYGDTDSSILDLSFIDKETSVDDIVEFADEVGKAIDNSFPDFMQSVFNCTQDRAKVVKTDREIVSDRSFFQAKKMYAMHLVDKEGQRVDTMKIMGLAIKKTDTPAIVKTILNDIVEMMLNRESYDSIRNLVYQWKKVYSRYSLAEIGRPVSAKKLKPYIDKYKQTGSLNGFPGHIRAAIIYNSMCGESDRKIRPGDKIVVLYLKNSEHSAIAIPKDAEKLPDFIDKIEIDWEKQWQKVDHKIELFLKPVGFDRESRQQNLNNTLITF